MVQLIGEDNSRLLPLVYALMSKKNTEAYTKLFTQLVKISEKYSIVLHPEYILSDFEMAVINTTNNVFAPTTNKT